MVHLVKLVLQDPLESEWVLYQAFWSFGSVLDKLLKGTLSYSWSFVFDLITYLKKIQNMLLNKFKLDLNALYQVFAQILEI